MTTNIQKDTDQKDTDAEMSVLCCIMLNNELISNYIDIDQDCFYESKHKAIWIEMINMWQDGINIDIITLASRLEKNKWLEKMGGSYYLMEINDKLPSDIGIENYIGILKDKLTLRKISTLCKTFIEYNSFYTITDWVDKLKEKVENIFPNNKGNLININDIIDKYTNEELYSNLSRTQFKTGLTIIDNSILFKKTDLVLLGGATSSGKTAISLFLAKKWANNGHKIGYCSIEMPNQQIIYRLAHSESVEMGYNGYKEGLKKLVNSPIWITDSPDQSLQSITSLLSEGIRKHKIEIFIIDYLQLMQLPNFDTIHHSISNLAKGLKLLAKKNNVLILCLVQIKRGYESRARKRPFSQDLKESGDLENHADTVILTYRPFTFMDNLDKNDYIDLYGVKKETELNLFMLLVTKQRGYITTDIPFYFKPENQSFYPWSINDIEYPTIDYSEKDIF